MNRRIDWTRVAAYLAILVFIAVFWTGVASIAAVFFIN